MYMCMCVYVEITEKQGKRDFSIDHKQYFQTILCNFLNGGSLVCETAMEKKEHNEENRKGSMKEPLRDVTVR